MQNCIEQNYLFIISNIFTLGSVLFIFIFYFLIKSTYRKSWRGEEKNSINHDTREIRNASDSFFVEARPRLTADACNTEPHQLPQK